MGCVYYYKGEPYESLEAIRTKLGGPPTTRFVSFQNEVPIEKHLPVEEETAGSGAFKKKTLVGNYTDPYIKAIDEQIVSLTRAITSSKNKVQTQRLRNEIVGLRIQKRSLTEEATLGNLITVGKSEIHRMSRNLDTGDMTLRQMLDNLSFLKAWERVYDFIDPNDIPETLEFDVRSIVGKANALFVRYAKRLFEDTKRELINRQINPKIAESIDQAYKDISFAEQQFITTSFDSRPIAFAVDTLMHDASVDINKEVEDVLKKIKDESAKVNNDLSFMFVEDSKTGRKTLVSPHKQKLYDDLKSLKDEIKEAEIDRSDLKKQRAELIDLIKKAQLDGDNTLFASLIAKKEDVEFKIAKHKKDTRSWDDYHEFMKDNFDYEPDGSMEEVMAQYEKMKESVKESYMQGLADDGLSKALQEVRFARYIEAFNPVTFLRWVNGEPGVRHNKGAMWFKIKPKDKWKNDIYSKMTPTQREYYEFFTDLYLKSYEALPKNEDMDAFNMDQLIMKFSIADKDTIGFLAKYSNATKEWFKDLVMVSYQEDNIDRNFKGPLSGQTIYRPKFKSVMDHILDKNGIWKEGDTLTPVMQTKFNNGLYEWKNGILVYKSSGDVVPKYVQKESDPIKILEKFALSSIDFKFKQQVEDVLLSLSEIASKVGTIQQTSDGRTVFDLYDDKKVSTEKNLVQERIKYTIDSFLTNQRKNPYKVSEKVEPGGSAFSGEKLVDTIIDLTRARNMGLNPFSGVGNLALGTVNNSIYASGKQFFNEADLRMAYYKLRGSTTKIFDLETLNNEDSKKAAKILRRWNILGDFSEQMYRSDNPLNKVLDELYVFQRRGEFLNQGAVLVAMMLNHKITDKNGKERSLWDMLELDVENDTLKVNPDFEGTEYANSRKLDRFFSGVQKVNKKIHGDYDPRTPLMFKKNVYGRALMQFRTWLPMAVRERFGKKDKDILLSEVYGRDIESEGRWRTTWRVAITSADTPLDKAKNVAKLLLSVLGTTVTNKRLSLDTEITELDKANISMAVKELWYALLLAVATATIKVLAEIEGDDDEEAKRKMSLLKTLYNQTSRVESELWFLYSPSDMKKFAKDFIPAISTVEQLFKIKGAAQRLVMEPEKDIYESGFRKGTSKFWKEIQLFAPITKQGQNVWSTTSQIFDDDPYQ